MTKIKVGDWIKFRRPTSYLPETRWRKVREVSGGFLRVNFYGRPYLAYSHEVTAVRENRTQ